MIMPALLATSIGLGVNNGRAVIEALIGYKTGFARTPKRGDGAHKRVQQNYQTHSQNWATMLELGLAGLYSGFLIWALYQSYWVVTPFLSLFAIGFFYTSLSSLWVSKADKIRVSETDFVSQNAAAAKAVARLELAEEFVAAE